MLHGFRKATKGTRETKPMITGLFIVERHEEYGEVGLRLKSRPWFEPLGGMAVAHDLLEHFPDDDGTLAGELQALGASIFVRDHGAYLAQKGAYYTDPSTHLAADMVNQVQYTADRNEDSLPDCGPTRALDDDYTEAEIQATLQKAVELIRAEAVLDGDVPGWLKGAEQRRRFVGWLRRGYRRARRRYRNAGSVCAAFMEAEKAVDAYLREGDYFEGAEVRVSIDVNHARAFVRDLSEEEF